MLYKAKLLLFVLSSPMLNKCLFCLHFFDFQKENFKNFRNRLIDGFIFDEKILIGCPTLLHRARALTARVTLNLKAKFT